MNYRHAFHAGNFADVIKHVALVAVLLHLARKDKGFCVIDSHAGAGLYDLGGEPARRTGEADGGIARLAELCGNLPVALAAYLDCIKKEKDGRYPGSARIAARLLRPQDRLFAIEKQPEEAANLRAALAGFANARAIEADGYARLPPLLPPPERRATVLIDPPYEDENEFARVADLVARAHLRFATGIYLVWYPIKSHAQADSFHGEVQTRVSAPLLRIEIDLGGAARAGKERLHAAGLLVVNPPYGLADEMKQCAALLAPRLAKPGTQPAAITITPAEP